MSKSWTGGFSSSRLFHLSTGWHYRLLLHLLVCAASITGRNKRLHGYFQSPSESKAPTGTDVYIGRNDLFSSFDIPGMIFPSFSSFFKWWTRFTLAAWCRYSGVSWRKKKKHRGYSWPKSLPLSITLIFFSWPYTQSWQAPWKWTVFLPPPERRPGSAALFGRGGWCSVWSWSQHPEPQARDLHRE